MFSSVQLRPLKIRCDAPAYEVVQASGRIGMRPKTCLGVVKACRATVRPDGGHWRGEVWRLLFAFGVPEVEEKCGCGGTLPERRGVLLRTRSGSEIHYVLTQCGRCRTILWDEERTSGATGASVQHGK